MRPLQESRGPPRRPGNKSLYLLSLDVLSLPFCSVFGNYLPASMTTMIEEVYFYQYIQPFMNSNHSCWIIMAVIEFNGCFDAQVEDQSRWSHLGSDNVISTFCLVDSVVVWSIIRLLWTQERHTRALPISSHTWAGDTGVDVKLTRRYYFHITTYGTIKMFTDVVVPLVPQ